MKKYLLSCDWGTSSFRLRLIDLSDKSIVDDVVSGNGVGDTFRVWKEKGIHLMPQKEFFKQHLREQILILARKSEIDLAGIPVVLSGMTSSTIGMQELPYAETPFELDGSSVLTSHMEAQASFPNDIILVSGARSSHDVMRGEETQLIGLNELVSLSESQEAIFIFPGTHSKHMYISNGQMVDFKTFMTGEIFNLMANYSILKDSVDVQLYESQTDQEWGAFDAGIRESGSGFILNSLFTVRTNQLFDLLNKKQNAMYLSGLLIGSELRYLDGEKNKQLVLCSGNNLFELYKAAINALHLGDRTMNVPAEVVDKAATIAHLRIFEKQNQH
jgi:2-dehydro-3-deoxygalactonokinase